MKRLKITEKPMVIQYVGSASITYVDGKFQQWPVQIITCMEYHQNIEEICLTSKLHLFHQLDHMVMYLLIQVGNNDN